MVFKPAVWCADWNCVDLPGCTISCLLGTYLLVEMLNDFWALLTFLAVHWVGVVLLDEN